MMIYFIITDVITYILSVVIETFVTLSNKKYVNFPEVSEDSQSSFI